ncbi:MAG: ammonium transporter [Eubacterium sp.]
MTLESISNDVWGIWFLIGAALVFFMQCGFAMVETGFTRAKNAGNIIMKNLMDFCIGTVMFMLIGGALMLAEDYVFGIIGVPNMKIFTDFSNFDSKTFVFNLVFCATAATIVSGAMAERTKFITYCIYSGVISAVVYPIEAGWVWNPTGEGWLAKLGYVDFAGSSVIHMVGGITAFIGAALLGPRIGKYERDKNGKVTKINAIPGHSLTLGALGCFILWFGWYGFNGAACVSLEDGVGSLSAVFLTTTIAPAVASCVTMIFTWIKDGKPDVSMTLNASLAGLVGITAGCANLDAVGATVVGVVSGILVVAAVEFIDKVLHIDDPVGAVAVHACNGMWGGIAVGFFDTETGLFYGGGWHQLGVQLLGVFAIALYTVVIMSIVFIVLKKTIGLRVTKEEEIGGLDSYEHGLDSAYAGFNMMEGISSAPVTVTTEVEPVEEYTASERKLSKVQIICKEEKFNALKDEMNKIGVTGMTVTKVMGCGVQKGKDKYYRGVKVNMDLKPKVQVDIVVAAVPVKDVVNAARKALYTGEIGDGKIFVYDCENAVKVRTGEIGFDAMQGEQE